MATESLQICHLHGVAFGDIRSSDKRILPLDHGEARCDICYLPRPCSLLFPWRFPRLLKMLVLVLVLVPVWVLEWVVQLELAPAAESEPA